MPHIYFGFLPNNRNASKLAISTPAGDLEPIEPSKVKVFARSFFVPIYAMMTAILGLIVAIASYPQFCYIPSTTIGLLPRPATSTIPFLKPGLAIVLKKGATLLDHQIKLLEDRNFTSMQYNGCTVWLKERGSKTDLLSLESFIGINATGNAPSRYLNTAAFQAYLTLLSVTTRITELFHILSSGGTPVTENSIEEYALRSRLKNGWVCAAFKNDDDVPVVEGPNAEFKEIKVFKLDNSNESVITPLLYLPGASSGTSYANSGVAIRSHADTPLGFITVGLGEEIRSHGLIFKFNPRLALPDPNLIGDVLGRHFLHCLGETIEEQFENLAFLKSGLANLRLTRLGDELTHLYKCIEIAIDCHAGCLPIFNGSIYEGTIVCGGPGASVSVNGVTSQFLETTLLKQEFLLVSDHARALSNISHNFPEDKRKGVIGCRSMVALREYCLSLQTTQETRDDIIRIAANLDFSETEWVISPAMLKAAFVLIADLGKLSASYPIGRLCLFSTDPVLVAFSCFGEKSCPSWEIPSGTTCSLKGKVPPSPPPTIPTTGRARRGPTSDAGWIMVIRMTDLYSSIDEFKKMAETLSYRSTSSVLARRVGHRVFGRDRMNEFWLPMQEALRGVNPKASFEGAEPMSSKKREFDGSVIEGAGPGESGKKRRLGF
jgi:hypothetical protein